MQHEPSKTNSKQDERANAPIVPEKMPWEEPKLQFVEPRLTHHGELLKVTGQFFGGFTPGV